MKVLASDRWLQASPSPGGRGGYRLDTLLPCQASLLWHESSTPSQPCITASSQTFSSPQASQPGTQAMPLPSASLRHFLGGLTEEEALTNALTASLAEDSSGEEDGGPATRDEAAMPQSGISFAKMTAMGFAATGRQHTLCPVREPLQQASCHALQLCGLRT